MKKIIKDEEVRKLKPPEALLYKIDRNETYKRGHTKEDPGKKDVLVREIKSNPLDV